MSQESPHRPSPPLPLTWEATLAPHEVRLTVRDGSQGIQLIVTGDQLAVRGVLERTHPEGSAPEPTAALEPADGARKMPRALRPASGTGAAF